MWTIRNFVVCVLCQDLQLKHCQRLNPSAPGNTRFVGPRSSGDVVLQQAGVDGLANNLRPLFPFFPPLWVFLCPVKSQKWTKNDLNMLSYCKVGQFKVQPFSPELFNIWTTAVSILPKCTMQTEGMTPGYLRKCLHLFKEVDLQYSVSLCQIQIPVTTFAHAWKSALLDFCSLVK